MPAESAATCAGGAPLHVGLFLPELSGGGGERVVVTLANALARRGHRVDLVAASFRGPYTADVTEVVRVVDLAAPRTFDAVPRLISYLRRERPQLLLSTLDHANVSAIFATRLAASGTRVVVRQANQISRAVRGVHTLRQRVLYQLVQLAYRKADGLIAVSDGVRDDLAAFLGLPAGRVRTVYSPLVTDRILAQAAEPLDDPWFADCSSPLIAGMGRLTHQKGFDLLIEAVARVRARRRVRLAILGEGELREELTAAAAARGLGGDFHLVGFHRNPFPMLRAASLFALPSRWEGLPGSLVQAMALGVPVVAADCPSGPAEVLRGPGLARALVPVEDVAALARSLEEHLDCPLDAGTLRARGMEFHEDRSMDDVVRVLRDVAS
jgi:glycosyltransferase involved in cell wall biosynthesis